MTDFVYDVTAQPIGKIDGQTLSVPANQALVAAEWNQTAQNILDLRNAITNGRWHALQNFPTAPLSGVGQIFLRMSGTQLQASIAGGAYASIGPATATNVLDYGADPMGIIDSSLAFNNALSIGPGTRVQVPAGTYKISNPVFIKYATTLELLPGAQLNLSAALRIDEDMGQLLGWYQGEGITFNLDLPSRPILKWIGAANSYMIGVMQTFTPPNDGLAQGVKGLTLDGNGVAGITGIKVGASQILGGNPSAWTRLENIQLVNVKIGVDGVGQQHTYRDIHMHNYGAATNAAGSVGLLIASRVNTTTTALFIQRCTIENFLTGVQFGSGAIGGVAVAVLRDCVIEGFGSSSTPSNGAVAITIQGSGSGPYYIENNYFESGDDATHANTCLQIGSTAAVPGIVHFYRNRVAGFVTSVEGISWPGFFIRENDIYSVSGAVNANSVRFRNTNSGLAGQAKINGEWKSNWSDQTLVVPDLAGTEANLWRGFREFERANSTLDPINAVPFPTVMRNMHQGTDNTIAIALNATFNLPTPLNAGAAIEIVNAGFGGRARFFLRGILGSRLVDGPYEDGSVVFSNVQGTANKVNVYWNAGAGFYQIENKLGGGSTSKFAIKYEEW